MKTKFAATLAAAALAALHSARAESGAEIVFACPGADASREAVVTWHSQSPSCSLSYAAADGARKVLKARCEKTDTPVEYTGSGKYWRYTARLENLRPGTEYAYKIRTGAETTNPRRFKTAPRSGDTSFLWIGDIHSTKSSPGKMECVQSLVDAAERMAAPRGFDFILSTGDIVKRGKVYSCWKQWTESKAAMKYLFATICGNKEYYGDSGKARLHNRWFLGAISNPANGAPGLESTCWFIHGDILFIGLDTLASEAREQKGVHGSAAFPAQREWLERTVAAQKGKFKYLVVFQHYPYFKKDGPCGYGDYGKWRDTFDKCGVDFALSGDSHSYVRSRPLRGGKENPDGTVYMVCPEIDARFHPPAIEKGEGTVAAFDSKSASYGACLFTVRGDTLSMRYFGTDGTVYDSASVKAKRRRQPTLGNKGAARTWKH